MLNVLLTVHDRLNKLWIICCELTLKVSVDIMICGNTQTNAGNEPFLFVYTSLDCEYLSKSNPKVNINHDSSVKAEREREKPLENDLTNESTNYNRCCLNRCGLKIKKIYDLATHGTTQTVFYYSI